jgi:tryptophan halogenase
LKVAVIGGGTAGFLAATQVSKFFPSYELIHIKDPKTPSIGVGEGTLPGFKIWLHSVTGVSFPELQEKCNVTKKYGVIFEDWGKSNRYFNHDFTSGDYAYHVSAAKLPELLDSHINGTRIDDKVTELHSDGRKVDIGFENFGSIEVDFCFDARGFPDSLNEDQRVLSMIPTNSALILRGQKTMEEFTHSIARPHGWIFVIPLATHTSYGYIYNKEISSEEDIRDDFHEFMSIRNIQYYSDERSLSFPSFMQRKFFDGSLFKIGNQASFLEPLEASAIGVILFEIRLASYWLANSIIGVEARDNGEQGTFDLLNWALSETVQAISLFVGWHYSMGSTYDTPFWQFAQENFTRTMKELQGTPIAASFNESLKSSGGPIVVDKAQDIVLDEEINQEDVYLKEFGGFGKLSFAQVGYGIGYYRFSE